jgi:IS30 family transposase
MREIRARARASDKGAAYRVSNRCIHRMECRKQHLCAHCFYDGSRHCRFCRLCNEHCGDFVEDVCLRLSQPPYVCNGCRRESKCVLRKRFYLHSAAQDDYRKQLVETRRGANITEEEVLKFDATLYGLTAQGQSIHAVMANHADLFSVHEKTVYRYVAGGLLHTRRHDLPRACTLKPRKAKPVEHKVDAQCRIGRTYADYLRFIEQNPGRPVTEMDTVEGVKGGKVLLTLMFMPHGFMAAFLLPAKTAAHVTEAFATVRRRLAERFGDPGGLEMFAQLFPVILTDNGTEFSAPSRIETDAEGNQLTRINSCDPNSAFQKAHVERNQELLRKILPRGTPYLEPTSFDDLTQDDLDLAMSHLNSYLRESLKDRTPYDLFATAFGTQAAELFGVRRIPADNIVLKPSLLGIAQKTRNLG